MKVNFTPVISSENWLLGAGLMSSEDFCRLEYNAVQSEESNTTFQRKISSPSSWMKSKPRKRPARIRQQIIQTFYVVLKWKKVKGGDEKIGEGNLSSLSELPSQVREAICSPELDVASSRLSSYSSARQRNSCREPVQLDVHKAQYHGHVSPSSLLWLEHSLPSPQPADT